MSSPDSGSAFVTGPIAALFLVAFSLISSDPLRAQAFASTQQPSSEHSVLPIRPHLDTTDAIAALDAVQIALTEAGDGATYVWQRHHGRLNGAIRMTRTFRDSDGRLCRHLVMSLTAGAHTRRTEGIACRGADLVWSLDG